jgi:pyocin large subunit-like protein
MATSVSTFIRPWNGDVLFYREATNEFALMRNGVIVTYMAPDEGLLYWLSQVGGAR